MYPRKTISQLHTTEEDGIFIVLGTIVCVLNVDQWYYLACKCHKAVVTKDDLYYCPSCQTNVVNVIPRYRLRVEVFDGSDTAAFTLFDSDSSQLLQQSCAIVVKDFKPTSGTEHPNAFHKIIGMDLLFKVEKDPDYSFRFDDSYRVKKICDDVSIIQTFKSAQNIRTPMKSTVLYTSDTNKEDQIENEKSVPSLEDIISLGDDHQFSTSTITKDSRIMSKTDAQSSNMDLIKLNKGKTKISSEADNKYKNHDLEVPGFENSDVMQVRFVNAHNFSSNIGKGECSVAKVEAAVEKSISAKKKLEFKDDDGLE